MQCRTAAAVLTTIPASLASAAAEESTELVFHLEDGVQRLGAVELCERVQSAASWLRERGVGRGSRVGLLGPNRPEWAVWAYATWWIGAALVPIQVPVRVRDPQAFQERVQWTSMASGCDVVMCSPALLASSPPDLSHSWVEPTTRPAKFASDARLDDIAVIQYTSGSTAEPKGVVLDHARVMAQFDQLAKGERPLTHRGEVAGGWVPFFHDLGLFGFLLAPVVNRYQAVHLLPTETFAGDPSLWLELMAAQHVTFADAPQSAWTAALVASQRRGRHVDLSSLECAVYGAEGLDVQAVTEMLELCPSIGLSPDALMATYGLAEAVLGVTATPRGAGLRFDDLRDGSGRSHRFVSCGPPLPDTRVRIVVEGREVGDGQVGEIQVAGPCVMSGYLDPATPNAVHDGWLSTGDLGYLRGGELMVTGRIKDVVIVMGQNYYPEDLEWAAARVPGTKPGRCAAFVDDERAVLLVEASDDSPDLAKRVKYAVADAVGLSGLEVNVVPAGTVEKTTSGKLRRSTMRELYRRGELAIESSAG
ncbi:MAG TPA: AMP-binding protein [Mycobacteriales bacterium]|nr:AMP-binding protein [Mycobacteriales bacterium]